jgi:hypothetical protein
MLLVVGCTMLCTFALSWTFTYLHTLLFDFGAHPERAYRGGLMRDFITATIVVFSSQMVYANAIKHNIISRKQPLAVRISTDGGTPAITVSNPVQRRKTTEEGEGIGLANLAERYRLKWRRN